MKHSIVFVCSAMILSACASPPDGEFPSLAKRPFETQDTQAATPGPAAPVQVPAALPAPLAGEMGALEARIRASQAAFNRLLPAVRGKANSSRGAARNSESWVSAHAQISRLDKSRSDGVAALAEIDRLITAQLDRQITIDNTPYSMLLVPRQRSLSEIIESQNIIIDSLSRSVGI